MTHRDLNVLLMIATAALSMCGAWSLHTPRTTHTLQVRHHVPALPVSTGFLGLQTRLRPLRMSPPLHMFTARDDSEGGGGSDGGGGKGGGRPPRRATSPMADLVEGTVHNRVSDVRPLRRHSSHFCPSPCHSPTHTPSLNLTATMPPPSLYLSILLYTFIYLSLLLRPLNRRTETV